MERTALIALLEEADRQAGQNCLASLPARKVAEMTFHDQDRDKALAAALTTAEFEKTRGNRKYYSIVRASNEYVDKWLVDHCRDKIVLDYACGDGEVALKAAAAGAGLVVGLDISRVSVMNCRQHAGALGLAENTFFLQGDCENTRLPDNCVDSVICSGMLHHLDLSYAFPELRRIMKPGGVCLCIEALNYNPVIKLYRALTPAMRTEWERKHILSLKDVAFARRFFDVEEVKFWHLMSIAATPFRSTRFFPQILAATDAMDSLLLAVPLLRRMAWMFSFVLVKRQEG